MRTYNFFISDKKLPTKPIDPVITTFFLLHVILSFLIVFNASKMLSEIMNAFSIDLLQLLSLGYDY